MLAGCTEWDKELFKLWVFEMVSLYPRLASSSQQLLLPWPYKSWDCRPEPPGLATDTIFLLFLR